MPNNPKVKVITWNGVRVAPEPQRFKVVTPENIEPKYKIVKGCK